jgi:formylmethanofuran dehydrogenase subunit E
MVALEVAPAIDGLLAATTALHHHLCPRQVIGVRMGMVAAELLSLALPQVGKRLLTFVETDGCFSDGVAVATGCWVGRRTLRVLDHGKVAATFADTQTGAAWRVAPHPAARARAMDFAPDARSNWEAMLLGYQRMPADQLLNWSPVVLNFSLEQIVSSPGLRVECDRCGEEIMNGREVVVGGAALCRACAGEAYYRIAQCDLSGAVSGGVSPSAWLSRL